METIELPNQKENSCSRAQPTCPICNGQLLLLRGFYRCTRCGCNFCEACEGPSAGDE